MPDHGTIYEPHDKLRWEARRLVAPRTSPVLARSTQFNEVEKDTKRFPDTKGWAYAVFDYNPASDTFTPDASGTVNWGFACHTIVASKDYIFHSYQKR